MKTYLGIDVGSISTNLVLIGEKAEVLSAFYIRTEGDPIGSVKKGLKMLRKDLPKSIEIAGAGATGSARYLIGAITGADLVKNEITAHARGSSFFIKDVRTVIEIGGQDSKIIILENGVVVDFAMNLICLTKDTKIISENYLPKSVNKIKIGEKVLTHKGRFKKVEQVFERNYQGKIIILEISKLKTLKITPEHPVLALKREDIKCYQSYSRNNIAICKPKLSDTCKKRCAKWRNFYWNPKFIPAGELSEGDFIVTPLPLKNEVDNPAFIDYSVVKTEPKIFRPFKLIDKFVFKPELLRLLGYYLAEGRILYNRARWDKKTKYPCGISFVFNIKEENYINDIKNIVSKNFKELNITIEKKPEHNSYIISVYSKTIAEYIKYLCGSMADKKRLSFELMRLEPALQKEILKGFFRGDGQLRKRSRGAPISEKSGNRYCASTVSEDLAYQLYWLLLRNKIKCTLRKSSKKTKGEKYIYFIEIFGKEINKLNERLLIDPKKQCCKSFIYSDWFFEPIKKIAKYNFKGKVYNLEVEDDNSYVANTAAVHNCAAGTGSFLDAQSSRLGIPMKNLENWL